MKFKDIAPITFATVLLFASPVGHGQLVDQGETTLDASTNLVWLDMSASLGLSAQSILDGTDSGNLMANGWSFASVSQIDTLLTNGGLTGPFNGSLSPGNYDTAASFLSLLGATGEGFIQAFSSDGPDQLSFYTPTVLALAFPTGGGVGGADLPGPSVPMSVSNPTIGSWLVKSDTVVTAIPEPEIYAMMLAGLGALGWVGRKKRLREAAAA